MVKAMQGLRFPAFTEAGEMGKESCVGVPWEPLCVVPIQVLPFTGSVPLSKPVWDPGVTACHCGVQALPSRY